MAALLTGLFESVVTVLSTADLSSLVSSLLFKSLLLGNSDSLAISVSSTKDFPGTLSTFLSKFPSKELIFFLSSADRNP